MKTKVLLVHLLCHSSSFTFNIATYTHLPSPVYHRGPASCHHGPDPTVLVEDGEFERRTALCIQLSNVRFLRWWRERESEVRERKERESEREKARERRVFAVMCMSGV